MAVLLAINSKLGDVKFMACLVIHVAMTPIKHQELQYKATDMEHSLPYLDIMYYVKQEHNTADMFTIILIIHN